MSTAARIVALCLSLHVFASAFAHDGDLAEFLVDKGRVQKGVCAVTSCVDPELVVQLAKKSGLLIHAFDADPDNAAEARHLADEAGLLGDRLIVERLPGPGLPYADNSIDLLIVPDLSDDTLQTTPPAEMLRVLRPRARAIVGRQGKGEVLSAAEMNGWLTAAGARDAAVAQGEFGMWAEIVKPAPEGVDRWSHWMHGPDNNPLSRDRVIRAPYLTQWMGKPYYMAMPVVTTAAGGRIFVASGHIAHHDREVPTLNLLCARNGYNGSVLWTRKLPEGYLVHRSAFIATDDLFYLMDGQRCLLLDPETGEEKGSLRIPGVEGHWKWMALDGRTLYALVGEKDPPAERTLVRSPRDHWSWRELCKGYYEQPRIPWGFAPTLAAYDLDRKETRWVHREPKPMDSRALGILDGKLFFFSPESRIGCLDAASGKLLWANTDAEVLGRIEEPGKKLTSTPGFRTCCMLLCAPGAIFLEAQTHANVVALSAADGKLLWTMPKTRSNPNLVFADGKLIIAGIGPKGSTLEVDPTSGSVLRDLGFQKAACTRLTACPDAFFCRGEGLGRYDRATGEYLVDGSVRPGCMDGAIPANGLLYVGPWLCDCNLSLMGTVTLCPAGDFRLDPEAKDENRLERGEGDAANVAPLDSNELDWPTCRANNQRTAGSRATVPLQVARRWEFRPKGSVKLTPPAAVAGLVFVGGEDGKVRCVDAESGALRWEYATAGPIRFPPSVWEGRAFVGSGDGYIYALEAATGRLLWRFRAAPVERRIMVYGRLCSTWPVNSGVLVEGGVAYAAAGIIDRDGTCVYALDAKTGRLLWQNGESGCLDAKLRKGVSVQGDLTIARGRLWMAGGNQVSPASYDLKTGRYIPSGTPMGRPSANRGSEVAVFRDRFLVHGGRSMYSGDGVLVSPSAFSFFPIGEGGQRPYAGEPFFQRSSVPPAWDDDAFAFLTMRYTGLVCWEADAMEEVLRERRKEEHDLQTNVPDFRKRRGMLGQLDEKTRKTGKWGPLQGDVLALALCKTAIVAVCAQPAQEGTAAAWDIRAHDKRDGRVLWQQPLPSEPLLNGLAIDRNGGVLVALGDGGLVCFGGRP